MKSLNVLVLTSDGYKNHDEVENFKVEENGCLSVHKNGWRMFTYAKDYWYSIEILEIKNG